MVASSVRLPQGEVIERKNSVDKGRIERAPSRQASSFPPEPQELKLFYYSEIVRGKCLGKGTFGDVYEVTDLKLSSEEDFDEDAQEVRQYYQQHCKDEKLPQYAIKCLRDDLDDKKFKLAIKDIEREAKLLATMDHPNIIQLYSTSACGTRASSVSRTNAHNLFLMCDRLSGTLTGKIVVWDREKRRLATKPVFRLGKKEGCKKTKKLLTDRLHVAHDVASALAYLHSRRIIYRDLKADNVGFCLNGKTKLFDFGLARKLPRHLANDTFNMSGQTGSLPFMAPEVYKSQPYNEKADVHSFAILLWQILSLDLPYLELAYNVDNLKKKVFEEGVRPPISTKWPDELQALLKKAWAPNFQDRPSMEQICGVIKKSTPAPAPPPPKRTTMTGAPKFTPNVHRSSFL